LEAGKIVIAFAVGANEMNEDYGRMVIVLGLERGLRSTPVY